MQPLLRNMVRTGATLQQRSVSCRSYRHLDDVLYRAYGGDIFAAEEAVNSLQYTISSTASFQSIIEACLQVEPIKPVAKDLTVG